MSIANSFPALALLAIAGCVHAAAKLSNDQRAELKSEIRAEVKADTQAAVGAYVNQSRNQTWNEIRPWIIGGCVIAALLVLERIVDRVQNARLEAKRIEAEAAEDIARETHCSQSSGTTLNPEPSTGAK